MAGGLLDFLGRAATAGVGAESARLEGQMLGQDREQKNLLVRLKQEQDAAEAARQERLANAQIANYESLARDRVTPKVPSVKRQYDPIRGVVVDVNEAESIDIPNLPDRPEPKGPQGSFIQYVDAEGNPVSFNPTTREKVAAPAGLKPAGAAGDRNTATVRKQVAANKTNLSVIDDAIAQIQARPESVGLARGAGKLPFMGGVADMINQRVDPEGVSARASLANIGSLIIHDRSGAAVSLHEFPRLAPFIPDQSDTPEVALIKLGKLREALALETAEMEKGTLLVDEPPAGRTATPAAETPPAGPADINKFLPPTRRTP